MAEQQTNNPTHEIRKGPGKLDLAHALMTKGAQVEFEIRLLEPSYQPIQAVAVINTIGKANIVGEFDIREVWYIEGLLGSGHALGYDFKALYHTDRRTGTLGILQDGFPDKELAEQQQKVARQNRRAMARKQFKSDPYGDYPENPLDPRDPSW